MARSPRRSRSPEPRRSSHRGGGGRSPSPSSRYDRSHATSSSSRRPDERRSDDYRSKDRERERERERDRDRDRDHDRSRDSYKDRDRERDRDRDRERERDKDRGREGDRSRDRPRDEDRRRRDDRDERRDRDNRRDDRRDNERDRGGSREPARNGSERKETAEPRKEHREERDSPRRDGNVPSRSNEASTSSKPVPPVRVALASSPVGSPGPNSEEEKQRLKRERLEAWKKQREKQKLEEGKASSATPEPADRKPVVSSPVPAKSSIPTKPAAATPAVSKPVGSSKLGSFARMDLTNVTSSGLKRSFSALDDEQGPERKLEKLDLPDFNPEVQSGEAADVGTIGDDLAAEDGEEDVKPQVDENGDITMAPQSNGHAETKPAETKMEVDEPEEEEDPLDAFMKDITQDVSAVNRSDAKRLGLMQETDDDNEKIIKNKAEEKLQEAEALLAQAAAKSRKKDLPPPDHSKIQYEPFQKKFYRPPIEVEELDAEETELLRLEMDGIKVRGVDVPKPVRNWGAFGLPMGCLDIIQRKGWTQATPIQAQSIPAIMSGRDVIGIAKTGSGKTISYLLPLFRHVKDQRPVSGAEGPIAMVMGPTRELAMQIYTEIKPFAKALNFRVACCVGGGSISEDIAEMKKGAEVVICTPGRMIDLLTANNGRVTNVRRVTYIVLDEADRMFDMGFEPQVMKIILNVRPDAQKVLFSATFPKTMESLARRILVKPLEITVGGRSVVAPEIDQRVEVREADTKFTRLLEILGEQMQEHKEEEDEYRSLIFVDRQEAADDLFRELLQRGYVCASLHGGKEQVDREEAIRNFKNGDVPMIVATSVAARGLDVKELKLVINYDCPNHMEDYVHRAGRTGRAGNKGTCITFITPEQEKFSVDIVRALEASNAFIPEELKNMSDGFLAKIKAGSAKAAGSGFKGKGLERLDKRRDEKDRNEKSTYGDTSEALSLASREGAVIPYKPKTNEYKPQESNKTNEVDYTFTEIKVEIVHGPAPDKAANPALYGTPGRNAIASLPQQTIDALAKARKEGRHVDAGHLAKVVARLTQSIELTKAEKFGSPAPEPAAAKKSKDPDATDWHAVFPINDYPQKARWKATNKEQMTLLSEVSGASITMRGIYYPPGEEPRMNGEPKLHLLIESNDEMKVRAAVEEIRRNLVEASVLALNNQDRAIGAGASGRYTV